MNCIVASMNLQNLMFEIYKHVRVSVCALFDSELCANACNFQLRIPDSYLSLAKQTDYVVTLEFIRVWLTGV